MSKYLNNVEEIILPNGLRVLFQEDIDLPIVSFQLWVKVGSVFEDEKNNGLSHFLEHMVFKNTKRFPNNIISKEIEEVGGPMNAATSLDFTYYYIDILSSEYLRAADVLSEIANSVEILEDDFQLEKNVILEEISRGNDMPENVMWENLFKQTFSNHPYYRTVIGAKENIKNFSRQDMIDYYKKFYVPERMILCVFGDISKAKLQKVLEEKFSFNPPVQNIENIETFPESRFVSGLIEGTMPVNQTYFAYAWFVPNFGEDGFLEISLAPQIFGKGLSSRLYQSIKEKKNLVWDINAEVSYQKYGSLFIIFGTTDYEKLKAVEAEIIAELGSINNEKIITTEELEKVKRMTLTDFWLGMEIPEQRGYSFGLHEILGDYKFIFSML